MSCDACKRAQSQAFVCTYCGAPTAAERGKIEVPGDIKRIATALERIAAALERGFDPNRLDAGTGESPPR